MVNFKSILSAFFILLAGIFVSFSQESPVELNAKQFNFKHFSSRDNSTINENYKLLNQEFINHPEYGLKAINAPCENCFEIIGKRKIDEKYFVDADDTNRFYIQKAGEPIHFSNNGKLITINTKLKKINETQFTSSNFLNSISVETGADFTKLTDLENNQSIHFNEWSLYGEINGQKELIQSANWENLSAGDDGIKITEVFPGINAEFIFLNGAVKTNFVVKNIKNYTSYDNLWFEDKFSANSSVSFNKSQNEEFIGDFNVLLNNNEILNYGEGIAYSKNNPKEINTQLVYQLTQDAVLIKSEVEWLKELIKNGEEAVIDPVVTGSNTLAQNLITGSEYNALCGFDNSCDHNLTVQAPANATFDDVTWSFEYVAQGACWLEDGATRFSTGNCISPNQAGFFWFCNQIGGGTCNGNNISVWDDLGSCLPAPSCQPQNVDFTLHFYRSCWGPTGCNNTCIGANSPWTMTIHGRTIEYSNVNNPITVSSNNICQGETITATTSGESGVPPYTYEWSFDPSGTPVVATGSSASVTFPNDGNITLYSIVTDNCGNQVTESINVTVTPAPQLNVTATEIEICEGESTTIEASGGSGNYDWDNGLGAGASHTVSPTTTTTYNVSSTAGAGCQGVGSIEIVVNPVPNVDAGSNQELCEGDQVTLSASGANNYTWDNNVTDGVAFTPPVGTTVYTVIGESSGCEDTDQVSVTVIPEINFNVQGLDPSVCNVADGELVFTNLPPNEQVEITYTFNGNTVGPDTYNSDGSGEVIISDLPHGNYDNFIVEFDNCSNENNNSIELINPSAPTVEAPNDIEVCEGDQVTLEAIATAGSVITWTGGVDDGVPFTPPLGLNTYTVTADLNNCTDTDEVTVEVFPAVNFTVTTNDPSGCGTNDGSIVISGLLPNTNYTVLFEENGNTQGPNNITTNAQGEYEILNLSNSTFIDIEIENEFGCSNLDNGPYIIEEDGLPTVIAPNDIEICSGEQVTLTAQNPDNANLSWDNNVTDGTPFSPNLGTTTYTVTADLNGCIATDDVTVTVYDLPDVNAGNDLEICEGETVTLSGSGAQSYQWSGNISNNTPFAPSQSGTYTVTGISSEGCENTDEVFIEVIPSPSPSFTADEVTGCEPHEVVFSSEGNLSDCIWNFGDGNSASGCGTASNLYTNAGTYNVTLTATENGCEGSNTINQMIEVTSIPTASFSFNPDVINEDDNVVNFQNNSSDATDYFWDFGDDLGNSTQENPSYEYNTDDIESNQEYEVVLIASSGSDCIDSTSRFIRFEEMLIYYVPNAFTPDGNESNDIFLPIFTSGFDPFDYHLTIFNRWGERVFESFNHKVGWDGTYGNAGTAPDGVYIWKIEFKTSNAVDNRRVINGHVTLIR